MNHVFRIIWSRALGAWVVVSELAKSRAGARCALRRAVVPSLLAVACAQAHATDVWWDGGSVDGGDAAANANGGAGIWNTTLTNFDNALTGGVDVAWVNGDHRALFPANGTYTITLGSAITAGDLNSLGGNVTLTGNTLTLIGTPVIDGTGTLIIASALDGSDGLTKAGGGVLSLLGAHAFDTVQLSGGTLTVAAGSTLTSADTFVRAGATLDVDGTFAGTAGGDKLIASGTVRGAFDFGGGNDTVEFLRATVDGASLVGGAGNDRLVFDGMTLDAPLAATGFERTELRNGSALTLVTSLDTGTLAIDATSRLDARTGSRIAGALENAGHVDVGAHRLAIAGNYTGTAGSLLELLVSPGSGEAGGLDIAGDILGTTGVRFASDGSEPGVREVRVIDSPNDTLGNGGFVAVDADANGQVRLDGSPWLWSFAQDTTDRDWYLRTTQEIVVPEIPAVAVLHTIGGLPVRDATQRVFGRLNDARAQGDCRTANETREARANVDGAADCRGFWMAVSGDETRVSKGRGYAFDGDTNGVYIGADAQMRDTGERTLRAGWLLGYVDGNHWTDGTVAGTGPIGSGDANIRTHTPMGGFYLGNTWKNDAWLDVMFTAYLHDADIRTQVTQDEVRGNTLSLSANLGRRYALGDAWTIAPELELGADAVHWQDRQDFNGMDLNMADGLLGHARTALRVEREIEAKSGTWRPWMLLGVAETIGEPTIAATLLRAGTSQTMQSYANHDLGLQATIDVGVSAKLRTGATAFASLSYAQALEGTDIDRRGAEVGVRWTW